MTRRQFAIRLASTKEFVAVVPVNIPPRCGLHEVETLLWDELDKYLNPYDYEYTPVHSTMVSEAGGYWLVPRNSGPVWKSFGKKTREYYDTLLTLSPSVP
jgi:hypothetical protein